VSLVRFLLEGTEEARAKYGLRDMKRLTSALQHIKISMALLRDVNMERLDSEIVKREVQLAGDMLQISCEVALACERDEQDPLLWQQLASAWGELKKDYQAIWLQRNRRGGLTDSIARFSSMSGFLECRLRALPAETQK